MRIAIGGFQHESNSFAAKPTELSDFTRRITRGAELFERWKDTHHEMTGLLEGAAAHGLALVPSIMASATPGGPVTADAFETLCSDLLAPLTSDPPVDGMLLALHGAMVSERFPDGDGEVVRRARAALGPDRPLVVTLDFHTNVSQQMVDHSTALVIYKTNPHIDQRPRGQQAAALMAGILAGKVRPAQALAKPPMVWNILHQYTRAEPLRSIMEAAAELERDGSALVANVAAGYPYSDVQEMGPSVVVVTDNDADRAVSLAEELSTRMWECRDRIRIDLPNPAEAVRLAVASDKRPVVIVEMGDNIGGGSPGDSTAILEEIVRQRAPEAISVMFDPDAAAACAGAGIGAEVTLEVGGKTDQLHGKPVRVQGRVRALTDGRYIEREPRHGGATRGDQGLTAVVEVVNGSRVILNSRRTAPMSIHQLTSSGIAPEQQKILVVKAAIAYRAAYEPIAGEIVECDSPGITAVNPLRFEYKHVRRPLWPLPDPTNGT
jgi:microcystin degradation protein MlrC